jgi:galactokinase
MQEMDPTVAARCLHVVAENQRTLTAAEAFKIGAWHEVGALMRESHESLREKFQVVSRPIDELVHVACSVEGVYGARMTGGGFGGCAIAVLDRSAVDRLRQAVRQQYDARHSTPAEVIITAAAAGADWKDL